MPINDWKADSYRWFQYDAKYIRRSKRLLRKIHFTSVTLSGHDKRQAMFITNDQTAVLLHYLRDDNIPIYFPHGNSNKMAVLNRFTFVPVLQC